MKKLLILTLLIGGSIFSQDCIDGVEIELWDECYNIETTTSLDLSNSGLTGEIPPEIGSLTSLNLLRLSNNQLTGQIPETICSFTNMTSWGYFNISNNQFCPPYPGCVINTFGFQQSSQDTSTCTE